MIQLHHHAMILHHPDGRTEPMDMESLITQLSEKHGLRGSAFQPWVIEQVIEAILRHYKHDQGQDTIRLSELIQIADRLLQSFHDEVLAPARHAHWLDLYAAAQRAGAAFELAFFEEIRCFVARRAHSQDESRRILYLTGLRRCVKFLSGRRRWGKRCSGIRDEIVAYVREEALKSGSQNLSLAVLS